MRTRPLAALLSLAALAACHTNVPRTVRLQIAAVDTPAEVAPNAALVFTVTAYSGGCVRFGHLEAEDSPSQVTVRAWGLDSSAPDRACTADLRTDVVTVTVPPPHAHPLTVIAEEPDGTVLTKVVAVR